MSREKTRDIVPVERERHLVNGGGEPRELAWPERLEDLLDQSCVCQTTPKRSRFCFFPCPLSPGLLNRSHTFPWLQSRPILSKVNVLGFGVPRILWKGGKEQDVLYSVWPQQAMMVEVVFFFFFLLRWCPSVYGFLNSFSDCPAYVARRGNTELPAS